MDHTDGGCRSGQGEHAEDEERGVNTSNALGLARHPSAAKKLRKAPALCEHQSVRSRCKDCGGSGICEHQRRRSACKDCGGSSLCEHKRMRSTCKDCGGSGLCEHQRQRSRCKDCGGGSICEHQRRPGECKDYRKVKGKTAEKERERKCRVGMR